MQATSWLAREQHLAASLLATLQEGDLVPPWPPLYKASNALWSKQRSLPVHDALQGEEQGAVLQVARSAALSCSFHRSTVIVLVGLGCNDLLAINSSGYR